MTGPEVISINDFKLEKLPGGDKNPLSSECEKNTPRMKDGAEEGKLGEKREGSDYWCFLSQTACSRVQTRPALSVTLSALSVTSLCVSFSFHISWPIYISRIMSLLWVSDKCLDQISDDLTGLDSAVNWHVLEHTHSVIFRRNNLVRLWQVSVCSVSSLNLIVGTHRKHVVCYADTLGASRVRLW